MTAAKQLPIAGALEISNPVFSDDRGIFEVNWEGDDPFFVEMDFAPLSVQHSYNARKGTLRGLHYQAAPHEQNKLVSCVSGQVWDVLVDLRPNSPSYQQWHSTILSSASGKSVYIPAGCAHGFVTLEPNSTIVYVIENPYVPSAGRVLRWDDPVVGIDWPLAEMTMSERDADAPGWSDIQPL